MSRLLPVSFAVLAICLALPAAAEACICVGTGEPPTAEKLTRELRRDLDEALAVFVGEPVSANSLVVRFRVETIWKGELGREVVMATGSEATDDGLLKSSSCDMSFSLGVKYLVFGRGRTFETMQAVACSFTGPVQSEILVLLDGVTPRLRSSEARPISFVAVVGSVRHPGLVVWKEAMTVADALAQAGGAIPPRRAELARLASSIHRARRGSVAEREPLSLESRLNPADEVFVAGDLPAKRLEAPAINAGGQAPIGREEALCRAEKEKLRSAMAGVYKDFEAASEPVPVETLVAIDGRLRALLRDRPSYRPCGTDRELIYDPRWQRMGIAPGYWEDLVYSGELLVLAHGRAPDSRWRAHTLFSTVFGDTPSRGLGVMPDVNAARAYATEFPGGPFIGDVYLTLADFHKDLYMVLRDGLKNYKYECFARYIRDGSMAAQTDEARAAAIDYYRRALRLNPSDARIRGSLDLTVKGTIRSWSFCAD